MELLNTKSFALEEFHEELAPPYAILSHAWGDGEVSFQDMQQDESMRVRKKGYRKIERLCNQARGCYLECAWVNTCCI